MSKEQMKFTPVFGIKDRILNSSVTNGYFYVSTDTNEAYFDINNERHELSSKQITILDFLTDKQDKTKTQNEGFYFIKEDSSFWYLTKVRNNK